MVDQNIIEEVKDGNKAIVPAKEFRKYKDSVAGEAKPLIFLSSYVDNPVLIGDKLDPRELHRYIEENIEEWSDVKEGDETDYSKMKNGEEVGLEIHFENPVTPDGDVLDYKGGIVASKKALEENEVDLREEAWNAIIEEAKSQVIETYY